MTTLHVYSNRHIKDQVKTIKLGDWVYLENGMSRKRWSRYFSVNNINEDSLDITYITREEYFSLTGIKFDVIVGNPPYTDGQKLLYTKFFEQALDIAELVAFVMPVQLDSNHDKLKFHNYRVQKHLLNLSDNMSHHFNVGYDNIRCVYAKKSIENKVKEYKDPVDDIPLLYPNRKRLVPIKGDTDIAIGEDVAGGVDIIFKVHKGDTVRYKKVEQYKINKTTKKSTANFLVLVNHTPSKGRFNCAILPNIGQSWSMWTFAFECDTIESATKLKDWLQSETIVNEISKMLKARNNQHTISKALIEKLPTYE